MQTAAFKSAAVVPAPVSEKKRRVTQARRQARAVFVFGKQESIPTVCVAEQAVKDLEAYALFGRRMQAKTARRFVKRAKALREAALDLKKAENIRKKCVDSIVALLGKPEIAVQQHLSTSVGDAKHTLAELWKQHVALDESMEVSDDDAFPEDGEDDDDGYLTGDSAGCSEASDSDVVLD